MTWAVVIDRRLQRLGQKACLSLDVYKRPFQTAGQVTVLHLQLVSKAIKQTKAPDQPLYKETESTGDQGQRDSSCRKFREQHFHICIGFQPGPVNLFQPLQLQSCR